MGMPVYVTKLNADNVDETLDNVVFDKPTVDEKYGNISVRVSIKDANGDKHPLNLETPWMRAFVGVSRYDPQGANARPKFKLPVTFHKEETYERQAVFREFFEKLDQKMIDEGFENSGAWLKRAGEPKAVIKAFYSSSLVYSKTKTGEINEKYPPRLQFKLGTYPEDNGGSRFAAPVYKDAGTKLGSPLEAVQKGSEVKAI